MTDVGTDLMRRWWLEIVLHNQIDPEPQNEEEEKVLATLRREIEAIIAAGGMPDVVGE